MSQHALQVVSENSLQQVSRAVVVSQHALQVSRPTPRWGGGVEGSGQGSLQAHTLGEGEWGLQAHTRGVSRPTPRGGESWHALKQTPPMATVAGGTHPTGMHSCV